MAARLAPRRSMSGKGTLVPILISSAAGGGLCKEGAIALGDAPPVVGEGHLARPPALILEALGAQAYQAGERLPEGGGVARRHEVAVGARLDELVVAGDAGGEHRQARAERLEDDAG